MVRQGTQFFQSGQLPNTSSQRKQVNREFHSVCVFVAIRSFKSDLPWDIPLGLGAVRTDESCLHILAPNRLAEFKD